MSLCSIFFLLPPSDLWHHVLFRCLVRGSFAGPEANVTVPWALIWHTRWYRANSTLPTQSGRQGVGDGWRWIIDARHTDHKQNTQARTRTHQMHTRTRTHTNTHLSLSHPSFPIYSVLFFSVPSLILWWQRQMEGLRGERLTSRGGEISRWLLLWSEITLIATVGLYFSGLPSLFALFVIFFATSFMSLSLYFPSEPGIYFILVAEGGHSSK